MLENYGFTQPDLINLRFYCDVMKKSPAELVTDLKATKADPVDVKINEICYLFLSQRDTPASVVDLQVALKELVDLVK